MKVMFEKSRPEGISHHLHSREFSCKCGDHCDTNFIHSSVIGAFEAVRNEMGSPVNVTSGFRCTYHNYAVGGVKGSKHTQGMAIDLVHPDMDRLLEACQKHFDYVEMGKGDAYVHCHNN